MLKLLHYLFGYIQIELNGFSPERFLNLCRSHHLEIWGLEHHKDCYRFYMTLKGYRKVKPLVKKSHVRLRIIDKLGFPFFLYRNRRRKLFLLGMTAFFCCLYLLSLFVWDIQFEGNRQYTEETLMKYFMQQDITHGILKSKVSCSQLEDHLRTDFPEITWVSARISGTRLLVTIKENEVVSTIPETDQQPCNLVAAKDGVITDMIVRVGTPKVSVGDFVERGQILVAGEVIITNDADEVVNVHDVKADADILAQTEYHYQKKLPSVQTAASNTGKSKTGYFLKGFQYSYVFMLPSKADTHWSYVLEEKQLKLFDNFYLPFYLGEIKGKEYILYEHIYTKEEQQQLMLEAHDDFMQNLVEKGVQILQNSVKMLGSGSNCYMEGNLTAKESIVAEEPIIRQEETGETDERSGEYD